MGGRGTPKEPDRGLNSRVFRYPIMPDPQKSNSLSTRALSNFSLCLFISGLYCDGHNLMCYFKL